MFGNSIANRVKKVIAKRVEDAQKEHDEKCKQIDADAEVHKEDHALEMVSKVIGTV